MNSYKETMSGIARWREEFVKALKEGRVHEEIAVSALVTAAIEIAHMAEHKEWTAESFRLAADILEGKTPAAAQHESRIEASVLSAILAAPWSDGSRGVGKA